MVHTLTLNPAIDRILYLDKFQKNVTNRLDSHVDTIGGKGTHVSINLNYLGLKSTAFGVTHGEVGIQIINMLKNYGIDTRFIHRESKDQDSRINYLLIESNGDCSILASKGITLTEEDLSELIFLLDQNIQQGNYLVLSGDARNSPNPDIYNVIINKLKYKNLKIFLDTSGESLKQCIKDSPYLIKPNENELSNLTGINIKAEKDVIDAINSLEVYKIPIIAVSLGSKGSIVKTPEGIFRVIPPKINAVNTIGCGDCYLSGLVYGINNKLPTPDILRLATAISAAAAESNLSVGFNINRSRNLMNQVTINKL